MQSWLLQRWYSPYASPWYLRPLAALFGMVARVRRRRQQKKAEEERFGIPIIVVGNIAVGGTGKTPFLIWLVDQLKKWGWRPGVISRGYGGRSSTWPRSVTRSSDPEQVGDEPVLIAQRTGCPVCVGPNRMEAAHALLKSYRVNIIVSDDGLQHYRLPRDLEIVVVDGSRGLGNGRLLPAGPLREPPERLNEVDLVVVNGAGWDAPVPNSFRMDLVATEVESVGGGARQMLAGFSGSAAHAVAGIGNPARFFSMLSREGIELTLHPFPDHHPFKPADLEFGDDQPVLMTEKDAVKCRDFAKPNHWMVPVKPNIGAAGYALVQELTDALRKK